MAGLILKFPTGDRILLNGAVIENVGRGARLHLLTPDTQLLRLRDAIDPTTATTPVSRVAHVVQLLMLNEASPTDALPDVLTALVPLRNAFIADEDRSRIDRIVDHLRGGHFYQALRQLTRLRKREAYLLSIATA